jgi:hypothetical protein
VTRRDGVTTSIRGEATLGREKGVDDASWADVNLTGPKNEKNHVIDSIATNGC